MTEHPSGRKIVVTDDDSILVALIFYMLRGEGYTVMMAEDGETAVNLVLREKPDLLLLDLHLPLKDGLTVMQELKGRHGLNGMKILILSASENKAHIARAKALGAVDFVIKPFIPEELIAKVAGLLPDKGSHG